MTNCFKMKKKGVSGVGSGVIQREKIEFRLIDLRESSEEVSD